MSVAIRAEGLTRRFGKILAVDRVDLAIRTGTITAFLGPNGAGKTTTISLLLGLLKPQAGHCDVLGFPAGHPEGLARLGALVESPALYEHLTGFENVEITRIMRDAPRSESDRVLTLVGLQRDARRPVRGYSLGMRQRLGLALALIGEPQLLVLDEPTNGLDPAGIQEMRELIAGLPRQMDATVFLSSHILAEMEQVAQDVVVIHRGRIRYQGPLAEMGGGTPDTLGLRVDDPDRALQVLAASGFTASPLGDVLRVEASTAEAPQVAANLVRAGLALYELTPQRTNLETRFLAMTEGA